MAATLAIVAATESKKETGLAFWMQRVLAECDLAGASLAPDPVHDLRVALRRCRSMADGLMAMDPDPAWKRMKKAGKRVFGGLGELRDVHVMQDWVRRLGEPGDPVAFSLLQFLASRELQLKQVALDALREFDRKQWGRWSKSLPRRAARLPRGSSIFKHLALERWTDAYALHRQALRSRSQIGFHRLRIGLKRLRYIVENFLPEQHTRWSADLKELQDLLGDVHDLDVLWSQAVQVHAFPDDDTRSRWHARIVEERARRIETYRQKMLGKGSLWPAWRAELPQGAQIEAAALQRMKLWASFLDPDFKHSTHVARLALQLYDGFAAQGSASDFSPRSRTILQVAALLHDVGRSRKQKGHHKASYRLIVRQNSLLGYKAEDLRITALVARHHRGALPRTGQKALRGLNPEQRRNVVKLAGMLRLANAFDAARDGHITRLDVLPQSGFLIVAAKGYSSRDRNAEKVAAARHLLETVYRQPIMVKPLKASHSGREPRKLVAVS